MKLKKPKFWDYKKPNLISNILYPISLLINFFTNQIKTKKIKFENIKTICVGNIYLGGTGKTSIAIELKKIFDNENIKTCFIKKNYSDQKDEQRILENHGKTFINNFREKALKQAILEKFQVAIFDDGLQDNKIDYDISFVCFNKKNFVGNNRIIPAGPLRENLSKIEKYKNIFLSGNDEEESDLKEKLNTQSSNLNFYGCSYKLLNLNEFNLDEKYLVFSGIGNHSTFIDMLLKNKFKVIDNIEYPDHYNYKKKDIDYINKIALDNNAKILTTEKDFLRLNKQDQINIKFTKIYLEIGEKEKLKKQLMSLVNEKIH